MPKIDSMINAMANTASIATEFASAFSAADTIADTFATFASPINDYKDVLKYSSQYGEPNMRAIVITIADLEDSNDPNEAFRV